MSRIVVLTALLVMVFTSVSAQFGISARIQNNNNKTWNETYQMAADTSQDLMKRSYEFGINYWFRLKNHRVEFLPEISMAVSGKDQLYSSLNALSHQRRSYNFNFNVQIYPLDFFGDCNCPTFSKDGNVMSKGFYWLFSPGLTYHQLTTEWSESGSLNEAQESTTSFRVGIGAGLDFGVTDIFTLSPFVMYSMNFSNAWPEQYEYYGLTKPADSNNASGINQWHIGARLVFRPDYKKPNF